MKYSILIMTLAMSTNVMAFGDVESKSSSGATAKAGAMAGASSRSSSHQAQGQGQGQLQGQAMRGNDVTVQDSSVYEAYNRDNTPAIGAPGLVAGATTCLGSTSGGVSVPGFGISGGTTVIDKGCQAINGSIRFAQLGMNEAAVQVMCNVPVYRKTLMETGYDCKLPEEQSIPDAPETTFTSNASVGSGFMQ